jgi:hypothetical protein
LLASPSCFGQTPINAIDCLEFDIGYWCRLAAAIAAQLMEAPDDYTTFTWLLFD